MCWRIHVSEKNFSKVRSLHRRSISSITRKIIFEHIRSNAQSKKIFIDCVRGYHDHVHCLVSMDPNQTISKMIGLIKGESIHWINDNKILNVKIDWQDDYFAASISSSTRDNVRKYIENQEVRHKTQSFEQEHLHMIKRYGFDPGGLDFK